MGPAGGRLHKEVRTQIGNVVEQLAGAFKNFATDSAGRSHVQRTEALGSMCALLGPFSSQAELVLMIARITAKLSLLDPFRSQVSDVLILKRHAFSLGGWGIITKPESFAHPILSTIPLPQPSF